MLKRNKESLNYDQLLSLIAIYEDEWKHRDLILWKQVYRFFYISIFIMLIPQLSSYFSISLNEIPSILFPIIGILFSFLSIYVYGAAAVRLKASDASRKKLYTYLPKKYHKKSFEELHVSKLFSARMTYVIPITLHILVIILGILLIVFEICT